MQRRNKLVVLVIFTFAAMLFGLGRVVKPAQAQAQPRPPGKQPVRASVPTPISSARSRSTTTTLRRRAARSAVK